MEPQDRAVSTGPAAAEPRRSGMWTHHEVWIADDFDDSIEEVAAAFEGDPF